MVFKFYLIDNRKGQIVAFAAGLPTCGYSLLILLPANLLF